MERVLVVHPDTPGDESGASGLARSLRDAGVEVVYLRGPGAEQLVATAIQEDVDRIVVPGGDAAYVVRVGELLAAAGADDITVSSSA